MKTIQKLKRMGRRSLTIACMSVAMASSPGWAASAAADRVHPQFRHLAPGEAADVIVIHRADAPKGAGQRIEARSGMKLRNHFEQVGQSFAHLTEFEINLLANDPEVD